VTTALRPLTLGELLDRTFFLYRKHFVLFAGIVALPQLIALGFQLVGLALGMRAATSLAFAAGSIFWLLASLGVYLTAYAGSQAATVVAVSEVHLGKPLSIIQAFSRVRSRIPNVVLVMIAMMFVFTACIVFGVLPGILLQSGVVTFLGVLAMIVFVVVLFLMWSLAVAVTVLESKGLIGSIIRSSELTKGHRLRIFVILLLFLFLVYCVYMLCYVPVFAVVAVISGTNPQAVMGWAQVAIALSGFIAQCLVGPLMTLALTLVYYDERVRKEAFDIQLMMATLDGPQAGAASAT
jgi:hypothetical protein